MRELYCENCGSKERLSTFDSLKPPYDNLCVCEECADLPLRKIQRKKFLQDEKPVQENQP